MTDPILQEMLDEALKLPFWEQLSYAERDNLTFFLEQAVHRTREATVEATMSFVPGRTNRDYDGNNLESAADRYGIAARNWTEIIRFEDGWNACRAATLQALEALKERK